MAKKIVSVRVEDHTRDILNVKNEQIEKALASIGTEAMTYAIKQCPTDTGRLKNSIAWATDRSSGGGSQAESMPELGTVYVGTNVEYAPYVEFGTGKYADNGKGRKTPWAFQDSKGEWHMTSGIQPHHFLRDSLANHDAHFQDILEKALKS